MWCECWETNYYGDMEISDVFSRGDVCVGLKMMFLLHK